MDLRLAEMWTEPMLVLLVIRCRLGELGTPLSLAGPPGRGPARSPRLPGTLGLMGAVIWAGQQPQWAGRETSVGLVWLHSAVLNCCYV